MSDNPTLPLIGVPADLREITAMPFHAVGDKYLRAITQATGGLPVVIPAFGDFYDLQDLLARLDGVLLTGSPSNVHPTYYGQPPSAEAEPYDEERDATTLPLIRAVLDHALPMFAICRGMQELNVALGGTLHPRVHEVEGRMDHRRPKHDDLDVQYGPKHEITLSRGGPFHELAGTETLMVNSLHNQAVDRLAEGLEVGAVAPDGTIEAVSVQNAKDFALAVQWHPEYKVLDNPFSTSLFEAFGEACRQRAQRRAARPPSKVRLETA